MGSSGRDDRIGCALATNSKTDGLIPADRTDAGLGTDKGSASTGCHRFGRQWSEDPTVSQGNVHP